MHSELYADGIGEITVTGSVIRIDLVSLSATEKDERNKAKAIFRQRIIMPIDAFANGVDLMQKALASLVDAGALRRVAHSPEMAGQVSQDAANAGSVVKTYVPNTSPNFN
jgi:hypothetical protein